MSRNFSHWLRAYVDYTKFTEAPEIVRYWVGVSVIAGALQRRVGINQHSFWWYGNHYIIIVAPPDIIAKSTTIGLGMRLLRRLDFVNFGPSSATWPSLIKELDLINLESSLPDGSVERAATMTIDSSEFGHLLDTRDKQMIDLLVKLWDGDWIKKVTKNNGVETIDRPLLNLIAATTPSWVSDNIPRYMLDGGLLTRCIFVYAERKERLVAYQSKSVPKDVVQLENKLGQDLAQIGKLKGSMNLTQEAYEWGTDWYERLFSPENSNFDKELRRKQTHLHKLALVIRAGKDSSMLITREDLEEADKMLKGVEESRRKVFSYVGRSPEAFAAEELLATLTKGSKTIGELRKSAMNILPGQKEFENLFHGLVQAGKVKTFGDKVTIVKGEEKL